MLTIVVTFLAQFLAALFIRLGYHKYTDKKVYAINEFVVLFLILVQVIYTGITYLPFILGFFLVDFLFHMTKGSSKEVDVKSFIRRLVNMMPDKREEINENDLG